MRTSSTYAIIHTLSLITTNLNLSRVQLKKDLEEVITVTESLILKKQEKALDIAKDAKPDKSASKSPKHRKGSQADTKPAHPREWGVKADHYEVGQRCQVLPSLSPRSTLTLILCLYILHFLGEMEP